VSGLCGVKSDATFCDLSAWGTEAGGNGDTHKVCQVDMAFRVQQHVVWLDVPVHDTLLVNISHSAAELGYPEAHCIFGEGLPRDVEAQVAAIHEIHHDVAAWCQPRCMPIAIAHCGITHRYSMSWKL
jgi:hypothetical protein